MVPHYLSIAVLHCGWKYSISFFKASRGFPVPKLKSRMAVEAVHELAPFWPLSQRYWLITQNSGYFITSHISRPLILLCSGWKSLSLPLRRPGPPQAAGTYSAAETDMCHHHSVLGSCAASQNYLKSESLSLILYGVSALIEFILMNRINVMEIDVHLSSFLSKNLMFLKVATVFMFALCHLHLASFLSHSRHSHIFWVKTRIPWILASPLI